MNFFDAIPNNDESEAIFVADLFVEDYVGGAELTSQAIIESSPFSVRKIRSRDLTKEFIEKNKSKFWVFGNFSGLNPSLVPVITGLCDYVVLEYDYKFCGHRSLEKHFFIEKTPCDCHTKPIGDLIFNFFRRSKCIFWMSEQQQSVYQERFPDLSDTPQYVLSSVFNEKFFSRVHELRKKYETVQREGWLVLQSRSWIKGSEAGIDYCKQNNLQYRVVEGLSYDEMLEQLAFSKGLVFLPPGGDTCPRMVIEAKLLGCELILNDNVQHARETWFDTSDLLAIEEYLQGASALFWNFVKNQRSKQPTLSGYTTTRNCISQKYPYEQCISSMLACCDEVVALDGGSTDGTYERLLEMSRTNPRLRVSRIERDWEAKNFALFDGMQKAEARKLCTGDFCWQMDSDEIIHENDYSKVRELMKLFPKNVDLVSLPVVEYWGGPDKVRLDVTPWKWRMSRNLESITHGVPVTHREVSADGSLVAKEGTDGCDLVHSRTGEPVPFLGFYSNEAHQVRMKALQGSSQDLLDYQGWFENVVNAIPGVHHFSWYDLPRKIRTYKNYWTKHWAVLKGDDYRDTAETNMMFDAPWSDVTDEMIEERAKELKEIGGWVWHTKHRGQKTPSLRLNVAVPAIMKTFYG
jgi:glycosyltransferase involved in cell wall biosynthesis